MELAIDFRKELPNIVRKLRALPVEQWKTYSSRVSRKISTELILAPDQLKLAIEIRGDVVIQLKAMYREDGRWVETKEDTIFLDISRELKPELEIVTTIWHSVWGRFRADQEDKARRLSQQIHDALS